MSTTYDAATMTTQLVSVGAAALPFLGAGVGGAIVLAGAVLGINKGWSVFRKATR